MLLFAGIMHLYFKLLAHLKLKRLLQVKDGQVGFFRQCFYDYTGSSLIECVLTFYNVLNLMIRAVGAPSLIREIGLQFQRIFTLFQIWQCQLLFSYHSFEQALSICNLRQLVNSLWQQPGIRSNAEHTALQLWFDYALAQVPPTRWWFERALARDYLPVGWVHDALCFHRDFVHIYVAIALLYFDSTEIARWIGPRRFRLR